MTQTTCPLCSRAVALDAAGKLATHTHTPMLREKCGGSGLTLGEAARAAADVAAKLRAIRKPNTNGGTM